MEQPPIDNPLDDRYFKPRRMLLDSDTAAGEHRDTLTVRILLTCGTFATIFTVLCLAAVCLSKCCQSPPSAEPSDQEPLSNNNRNRTTTMKNRKQAVEEALTTFPAYTYGADKSPPTLQQPSSSPPAACSICLGEYQKGECLRRLPKCGHVFHKACIDLWLSTRSSSCPICRDQAVAVSNVDSSARDGGGGRGGEGRSGGGSGRSLIPSFIINFGSGSVL